jgi:hypothetical protein
MKYFYVDDLSKQEKLISPKLGEQYTAWYNRSSQNNPDGYEFVDVIGGEEVCLRAVDRSRLDAFLKRAFPRAPYVRIRKIVEEEEK